MAVIVPSATALFVAYLHRKQIRQVELFRIDPAAGLRPHPTRLWTWTRSNFLVVIGVAGTTFGLIHELLQNGPVTRWSVFTICFDVIMLGFMGIILLLERILKVLEGILKPLLVILTGLRDAQRGATHDKAN